MEIFLQNNTWIFILMMIWVLPWKAYALWTSARRNQKVWFILFVILYTLAILVIFYIFYIAKKTPKDLANTFKTKL